MKLFVSLLTQSQFNFQWEIISITKVYFNLENVVHEYNFCAGVTSFIYKVRYKYLRYLTKDIWQSLGILPT
jgi:hypothetical protein